VDGQQLRGQNGSGQGKDLPGRQGPAEEKSIGEKMEKKETKAGGNVHKRGGQAKMRASFTHRNHEGFCGPEKEGSKTSKKNS